ncbi:hypothetical protein EDD18DRAFT_1111275 [Armillaria luteobubalina]|uniref:Uncharacterized protein n=1 Tax=Armillaria luteobubalina TaxID=153913 RepID=A0AA39UFX2_9AGAR|nr:hypothetical protein EDD18DRAFT_1111275 [Armillaria luteobubalina]
MDGSQWGVEGKITRKNLKCVCGAGLKPDGVDERSGKGQELLDNSPSSTPNVQDGPMYPSLPINVRSANIKKNQQNPCISIADGDFLASGAQVSVESFFNLRGIVSTSYSGLPSCEICAHVPAVLSRLSEELCCMHSIHMEALLWMGVDGVLKAKRQKNLKRACGAGLSGKWKPDDVDERGGKRARALGREAVLDWCWAVTFESVAEIVPTCRPNNQDELTYLSLPANARGANVKFTNRSRKRIGLDGDLTEAESMNIRVVFSSTAMIHASEFLHYDAHKLVLKRIWTAFAQRFDAGTLSCESPVRFKLIWMIWREVGILDTWAC